MPEFNIDDFLLLEPQEPQSIYPVSNMFNPEMTFSSEIDDSNTGMQLREDYLVHESDWKLELTSTLCTRSSIAIQYRLLSQKPLVAIKVKADNEDEEELDGHISWKIGKPDQRAVNDSEAFSEKPHMTHLPRKNGKPVQSSSSLSDQESYHPLARMEAHQANAVNHARLRDNRVGPEDIFFLLLAGNVLRWGCRLSGGLVLK